MPFQSSNFGACGLSGGIALIRLSWTNERFSKRRSARSTCVIVRQAAWLASSGRFGTQSGTRELGRLHAADDDPVRRKLRLLGLRSRRGGCRAQGDARDGNERRGEIRTSA